MKKICQQHQNKLIKTRMNLTYIKKIYKNTIIYAIILPQQLKTDQSVYLDQKIIKMVVCLVFFTKMYKVLYLGYRDVLA